MQFPGKSSALKGLILKEYVASLIGLFKNNGAVLCGRINFLLMYPMAFSKEVVRLESAIGGVWLWADIGRNCNTFFGTSGRKIEAPQTISLAPGASMGENTVSP